MPGKFRAFEIVFTFTLEAGFLSLFVFNFKVLHFLF